MKKQKPQSKTWVDYKAERIGKAILKVCDPLTFEVTNIERNPVKTMQFTLTCEIVGDIK